VILYVEHNGQQYKVDTTAFHDLSIPYNFEGEQPNFYDVDRGSVRPFDSGDRKWSTKLGAGCNVMEIALNVHCTGTHTETVGHLSQNPVPIREVLTDVLFPAGLITVTPTKYAPTPKRYHVEVGDDELVIERIQVEQGLDSAELSGVSALIIRTLPNDISKLSRRYTQHPAPFFTHGAMELIRESGIRHLVVDLPSVDRADDGGILGNHRIFWGLDMNAPVNPETPSTRTITEMAYIPDELVDGLYFLSLQIPGLMLDAAPCRPLVGQGTQSHSNQLNL
jgi:arylformamidase